MTMSRTNLDEKMDRIRSDILQMSSRVEEDLRKAIEALRERDEALAAWVRDDDGTVNAMQARVQDLAATLMATQGPVAQDLRELVSSIRLADNLERIGDYAVHLAKTAIKLKDSAWPRQFALLAEMGERGCEMLHLMTEAFLGRDVEAAAACAAMDGHVDDIHHEIMEITLKDIKASADQAEEAIKLIRTSAFLERLADHVTNSCELVAYIVTGSHAEFND